MRNIAYITKPWSQEANCIFGLDERVLVGLTVAWVLPMKAL